MTTSDRRARMARVDTILAQARADLTARRSRSRRAVAVKAEAPTLSPQLQRLAAKIRPEVAAQLRPHEIAARAQRADALLTKADNCGDRVLAEGYRQRANATLAARPLAAIDADITLTEARLDRATAPDLTRGYIDQLAALRVERKGAQL